MAGEAWLTDSSGELILDDDGNVVLCDDCPCECPPCVSNVSVDCGNAVFGGAWNITDSDACYDANEFDIGNAPCDDPDDLVLVQSVKRPAVTYGGGSGIEPAFFSEAGQECIWQTDIEYGALATYYTSNDCTGNTICSTYNVPLRLVVTVSKQSQGGEKPYLKSVYLAQTAYDFYGGNWKYLFYYEHQTGDTKLYSGDEVPNHAGGGVPPIGYAIATDGKMIVRWDDDCDICACDDVCNGTPTVTSGAVTFSGMNYDHCECGLFGTYYENAAALMTTLPLNTCPLLGLTLSYNSLGIDIGPLKNCDTDENSGTSDAARVVVDVFISINCTTEEVGINLRLDVFNYNTGNPPPSTACSSLPDTSVTPEIYGNATVPYTGPGLYSVSFANNAPYCELIPSPGHVSRYAGGTIQLDFNVTEV